MSPFARALSALTLSVAMAAACVAAPTASSAGSDVALVTNQAPLTSMATTPPRPGDQVDRATLLVEFTRSTAARAQAMDRPTAAALVASARRITDRPSRPVVGRWVAVDAGADAAALRQDLLANPSVASVSYDVWRRAFASDPLYPRYQGYLRETMDFPQAWDRATGSGVRVAVIDSGVDRTHRDLGRVLPGVDFVDGGRVTDPNGHGTFVSGVVAAVRGNGRGIAGGSRATILPIRALDSRGYGRDSTIARGIRWAVGHGADIINLSLGGSRTSPVLADALRVAERREVLVVASSGNSGGTKKSYPAATPTVLAVGATDDVDRLTWFSQHGDWVDLVAPGWNITSTVPGDRYATGSGTSFSAPLVSAAAALLVGKHPRWPADRLRSVLLAGTADTGPVGPDTFTGFGTVDIDGTLGGPLSWRGAASYGGGNTTPETARDLGRSDAAVIAPEGGALWYVYQRSSPAQVLLAAASRDDAAGVRRLNLVLEIYDADLRLIRVVDREKGGRREETTVKLTDRVYVRVTNRGPTRSPADVRVTSRYIGTAAGATAGTAPRPLIVAATPRPNALGQDPAADLIIGLGRSAAPGSVSNEHVVLIDGVTGLRVPRAVTYDAGSSTVTIDPTSALRTGRDYSVVLSGLRSSSGGRLPDGRYGFRTD